MLDILWLGKIAAEFKLTSICAYFKAIEYGCVCLCPGVLSFWVNGVPVCQDVSFGGARGMWGHCNLST